MEKLFSINIEKYDSSKNFNVYWPSSLDNPKDNSVMFVNNANAHRKDKLEFVKECIVFIPESLELSDAVSTRNLLIRSDDPRRAYSHFFEENHICNLPKKEKCIEIDGALISESAVIGSGTVIMPFAFVGGEVSIGNNCYIGSGSRLVGEINIGNNVVIRENTVIGADGMSTDRYSDGKAATMPQFGGVIIEDDVQIGANCVIARGAIDSTIIKRGSKLDNSTFISHNVTIGEDTFIVGETIMFGGSSTGNRVYISGNSTIRNKVSIGDEAFIGMGAVVTKDVCAGKTVLGNPAHGKED